jgi:hypothetical protein
MRTREIPRDEWTSFFDNMSRRREGWEVRLEVFGSEIGGQVEEQRMYLSGVTAELRAKGDRDDKIQIMMGGKPSGHLTHVITAPTRVDVQQTDLGIDTALQIKSADGTTALLHLEC